MGVENCDNFMPLFLPFRVIEYEVVEVYTF